MKRVLKIFLKYYLKVVTKLALFVHRPTVIAVAGSTNKNFTKREIKKRLQDAGLKVRANPKNFNTEIGLPLAILDLQSGYNEYQDWLPALFTAPLRIFQRNFPDHLVLGLGTSDEGDMKYLLSIVKPDISVITEITQRYKEGFSDMDNLVQEYRTLADRTRSGGLLILNADNYRVKDIGKGVGNKKVIYFGSNGNADIRITKAEKNETGQRLVFRYGEKEEVEQINRFGRHHLHAFLIGFIIKKELDKK
ncbi:MAG: Mur ligase family protein [Candidatus Paceibacterota bacterium]